MKISYLTSAKADVTEIKNNLSQYYPSTPVKFLKTLKKSIETLSDNPFLYPVYEWNIAYRKMPVLDYLVFYRVFEDRQTIEIYRVLYGRRNIKTILEG
jgi:plasmid stabilization system protein ParE